MKLILVFFLVLCSRLLGAQELMIQGKVIDESGEGLPGITVSVKGTTTGAFTEMDGSFTLENIQSGHLVLIFSGVGFHTVEKRLHLVKSHQLPEVRLKESTHELAAVQVIGTSEVMEIRQKPFTVSAIDVEPLRVQNLDINQVLNTTAGVRIREEGGLGSNFNFSLNGFSGSQVKFFLDGIPMNYFGSSLTLNNIPANLISKIEVYKGVVPVHLGSDALGGAVNITTNSTIRNFINASYSVGSFNTHRASIISRNTTENGFVVKANAFYNYSDNNYKITVDVPDERGKLSEHELRRFHDGYRSQTIQTEVGVVDKKYADQLLLGVIASSNHKEIQTGYNMTHVIGAAFTEDKTLIPTLKYKKQDLFLKGLSLTANAVYKYGKSYRVDTASRTYDWYGNYKNQIGNSAGEISYYKTKFRFTDNAVISGTNVVYDIDDRQSISINNTYSYYRRIGSDPISQDSEGVAFSKPNVLKKNVTGVSYARSFFDEQVRTVAFGKLFHLNASTRAKPENTGGAYQDLENKKTVYGYGMAVTYFVFDQLQLKASYENTYRLPEAFEMFGDGLTILSNPTLQPEESQNYNVGFLGQQTFGKHQITLEGNYLYRTPKNLIRNNAIGNTSAYENLSDALVNAFEGDVRYDYNRLLNVQFNATFQDIVNNQKYDPITGGENYLYGFRIPNAPFFYGNAKIGLMIPNIGSETAKLSVNWSALFVEAFYLKWPGYGDPDEKKDIPRQISHSANLAYSLMNGRYNASLSCTNIFNSMLYDNFKLQKPGRAFSLKLSYFLQ